MDSSFAECYMIYSTTNSMRRFWARPSSVSLVALGMVSPLPSARMRSAEMPFSISQLRQQYDSLLDVFCVHKRHTGMVQTSGMI